jgi:hypothetical protein
MQFPRGVPGVDLLALAGRNWMPITLVLTGRRKCSATAANTCCMDHYANP